MKWFSCPADSQLAFSGTDLATAVHRLRHSFLNDLQVLGGWLQLGRIQAAKDYLSRVQSRLAADSQWSSLENADLEAVLFLGKSQAEGLGLTFTVEVAGRPDPAYVLAAASSSERRGTDQGSPRPCIAAILAIIRTFIDKIGRSRETGITGVDGTVGLVDGDVELVFRVPGASRQLAEALAGCEDDVLASGLLSPAEARPGTGLPAIGIEWRQLDSPAGAELVIRARASSGVE